MSRKQTKIPFIATHKLTATTKIGTEIVDVMAVVQDEQTRLFDAAEADEGRLPEWKLTSVIPPTTNILHGADGCRLQKNRKDASSASLQRLSEVVYFTLTGGELISTRAPLETAAPVTTTEHADGSATSAPAGTPVEAPAPTAAAPKPRKARTPRATPATTAATDAPAGRAHRPGSVQGMSVAELQAEFTAKTGQPAPSNSIHYMRKMVLAARNGKRDFKRRQVKVPTFTFTLDECKLLLSSRKNTAERDALKARVAEFVAQHNDATATVTPPPAAQTSTAPVATA